MAGNRLRILSQDQLARFQADGFTVLERFTSDRACWQLKSRIGQLLDGFDPSQVQSIFNTNEQTRTSDDYFLNSGDKIRYFFEAEAFDAQGALRQAKAQSINKIGHALHDLDPVFSTFSRTLELAAVAADIGFEEPLLMQSMYIFKQPRIGGEVVLHQDATFLYTEPQSVVGLWFAVEDATIENGCLWAMPGGHKTGLKKRFSRVAGGGTEFQQLDDSPFPDIELVPLEVPAGTLVVLHGYLPHWSGPNRSGKSRHAYAVHLVEAGADYPAGNWLQRAQPAKGFE